MTVTLQDIRSAAKRIEGQVVKTPCTPSRTLSNITGAQVVLKFENHQFTASFKDRGALVKLLSLSESERRKGVVAMSAGNHAQAVAYHAQRLGVDATIVMPRFTPHVKVEHTRSFGANVILEGRGLEEAAEYALKLVKEKGLQLVHPYDDDKIIAGQGTIALEMLEQFPDLDVLIAPVGGGGLIAGNAVAAKALKPGIRIIGVEAERFPSMSQMLAGKPVQCGSDTIAEGIAVKEPGCFTLPLVKELVDDIVLVGEADLEAAVLLLLEVEKTVVEGAGAAGLAALQKKHAQFSGKKVGLILTGGNIDLLILSSVIQRGLVRSGRLVRLQVGLPDLPGSLGKVTDLLGEADANIVEILHQRAFTNLSLQSVEVGFVLHTLGPDHVQRIVDTLKKAGYHVTLPDEDTPASCN